MVMNSIKEWNENIRFETGDLKSFRFVFYLLAITLFQFLAAGFLFVEKSSASEVKTEHRFVIGVRADGYPNHDAQGSLSEALKLSYVWKQFEKESGWYSADQLYTKGRFRFYYEKDPTMFDSDRSPESYRLDIDLIRPTVELNADNLLALDAGARFDYNGPGITEFFNEVSFGASLRNRWSRNMFLSIGVHVLHATYETDDEPAREQTGATLDMLTISGLGGKLTASAEYNYNKNHLSLDYAYRNFSDDSRGHDFQSNEIEAAYFRDITQSVKCGLLGAVSYKDYTPVVLAYKDVYRSVEAECQLAIW